MGIGRTCTRTSRDPRLPPCRRILTLFDPKAPSWVSPNRDDIESSGMGIRNIRELCDAAGVKVTYEEVSFGTKLTFHRKDPFAVQIEDEVRDSTR